MPRARSGGNGPSAGGKYAVIRNGRGDGEVISLASVTDKDKLWALLQDATLTGVSVTIGPTQDRRSLLISFYHDGQRYPWYIVRPDDWQEMVQAIEG